MDFFHLEVMDIVYAAALAFIIFTMVKWLWKISGNKTEKERENLYRSMLTNGSLEKCYNLFPLEDVAFEGESFLKGDKVNIKTLNNRTLEGILIGRDDKGRLCVVTDRYVIVHSIDEIFEMHSVGE